LSSAPHEELLRALADGDADYLVRLPGVGRKTAARLVLELQGKVASPSTVVPTGDARLDEAVLALVSLGLTQRAARDAVDRVGAGLAPAARVEDVVKAALQAGGRGGA
jgi:Holliday junction DNA helicase RuvA